EFFQNEALLVSILLRFQTSRTILLSFTLFNTYHFYVKNQPCIWRNYATGTTGTIAQVWRNNQFILISNIHKAQTFFPTFDNAGLWTNHYIKRSVWLALCVIHAFFLSQLFNAGVKQSTVYQVTSVMHLYSLAIFWLSSVTFFGYNII